MTPLSMWATDDLPPRGYPDDDKVLAVWGVLQPAGRARFRRELEAAQPGGEGRVIDEWYATMRVITDPEYAATQEHIEANGGTGPLLSPQAVRDSLDDR